MTLTDQPKAVYNDSTTQARDISDVTSMIDPRDTPLLARLGLDSAREKFKISLNGYKLELLEDELDPLDDAINDASGWDNSTTTGLAVDDASKFQDGHVILVGSEKMVIKHANTANNTIDVYARGFGGTDPATHADDTAIYIVGITRPEDDDADYGLITDLNAPYNFTSIFQKAIKVSRTLQAITQHEFMFQANKAVPHLLRLVERMAFYGERVEGSATAPRSAGGLETFITDNSVDAGGAIAKADVDSLMEEIVMDGVYPDLLVMNPRVVKDLRGLLDNSSFMRIGQNDNQLGLYAIERVVTKYGELELVMDRWCPTGTAYVLQSDKVGFFALRPFSAYELTRIGDSIHGEVVGEFSLLAANDKAHGKITGITT